ncbi:hypothetical protein V6N13_124472 [Hibiscus sabdariffa]
MNVHGKGVVHGKPMDVLNPHSSTCGIILNDLGKNKLVGGPIADSSMKLGSDSEENPTKRNRVKGFFDVNEKWISYDAELVSVASLFFMNLFASSSPTDAAWILDKVQAHVTTPMNAMLLEPFRKEEVWKVVKCQRVNFDKSLVYFSGNVNVSLQNEIGTLLGDGSNPSYVRSAKGLVVMGMGWRIGSSRHVNIWGDPWLPGPSGGFIRGHPINHNYTLISDLIDDHSTTWKLEARCLNVTNCCPLCEAAVESIEHVMKECTFIEGFLKAQGIHLVIYSADVSWKDRLALTFQGLSSIHKYALMVTFNTVWYARNKLVHEGLKPVLSNTLSFILASLKEYDMLQAHTCLMPTVTQLKWRASLENEVKVNFDSTFIQQSMRSVSGVICRDNEGFILAACSFMHLSVRDTFMAEALSCLQAITFAWELGFTRVVVEGDSRTVIMKCQSEDNDVSLITPEANMTAHIMAQEDKVFDCPMYWIEEAPPRTMLAAEKDRLAIAQG